MSDWDGISSNIKKGSISIWYFNTSGKVGQNKKIQRLFWYVVRRMEKVGLIGRLISINEWKKHCKEKVSLTVYFVQI